jgi:heterodisulfide reductase subunit A
MDVVKIGVYVCHCGRNIAETVRINDIVKFARKLPNVVVARDYRYLCADPGQDMIKKDIEELGINRVVVAACSPTLHEATFRKAIRDAGLNPFMLYMTSIRELDSWVTDDVKRATEKARDFVRAAVNRVTFHEELEIKTADINPDVLIIGGGIAGISSALVLAEANIRVYLVEKEPTIGGHMAKFDKTFPTLDCAACILTPKMSAVGSHPNITLITYSEVIGVDGYVGNFKVKVLKKPRYVREDLCIGCPVCVEDCLFLDTLYPSEFDEEIGRRKPIYIPFPQAVPLVPVIDPDSCIYFKGKCPGFCKDVCEWDAIDFNQKEEILELEVGTIITATGYRTFDAKKIPRYGYGIYDNVYTSLQVERMLNSTGPTGGEVLLADGRKPEKIAIIHCVGSRDKNYNEYCSKVCCMYSIKLAHLVKERTGAEVFNFYIDIRAAGKGYEEFYRRVMDDEVYFIRGKVAEVTDLAKNEDEEGKLIVVAEDTLLGRVRRIPVDMVILSVGLEPAKDAEKVKNMLKLSTTEGGWFLEKHIKLAPVSTSTDGIFIAGACHGPKDIPDTVAQAEAAAGEALSLIKKGFIELEPNVAFITEEKCSGCKQCIEVCPFSAIFFDEEKGISVVNAALCRGCGTCVATCPSGAAKQYLFRDEQILAEVEGVLEE